MIIILIAYERAMCEPEGGSNASSVPRTANVYRPAPTAAPTTAAAICGNTCGAVLRAHVRSACDSDRVVPQTGAAPFNISHSSLVSGCSDSNGGNSGATNLLN